MTEQSEKIIINMISARFPAKRFAKKIRISYPRWMMHQSSISCSERSEKCIGSSTALRLSKRLRLSSLSSLKKSISEDI